MTQESKVYYKVTDLPGKIHTDCIGCIGYEEIVCFSEVSPQEEDVDLRYIFHSINRYKRSLVQNTSVSCFAFKLLTYLTELSSLKKKLF